jgi:4-amino-4-deoxy-L-arabinose transferase-like glycosyltransferase
MAIALVTRLPGLTSPGVLVFDEQYYAPGAAEMLQWGAVHGLAKHPPLGWWLIASGIELFGFTPLGWRIAALIAGVATVGAVCAAVRRLVHDQRLAFLAGLLCALDGVMFSLGRLAMLDVFVGLFISLAVWALAVFWTTPDADRRAQRRAAILALVAVGLGAAVKWTVAPIALVVLGSMWAVDLRRTSDDRRTLFAVSLLLVVAIPAGLSLLAWAPRQFGPAAFTPASFVRDQRSVVEFHQTLDSHNANAAPAVSWFAMERPTRLFAQDCATPASRQGVGPCRGAPPDSGVLLLALPNPMVWATCLAALAGLIVEAVRRRSAIAVGLLAIVVTQWGPWLIDPRWAYTFYLTSIIPVLLIAGAWLVGRRRVHRWRVPLVAIGVVTVVLFAFFYPVLTGRAIPNQALGARTWWWGWPD